MAKKLDEATKEAIRADVRNMGKSGETKKAIAARHGIHPTMISKIMNSHNPKRKVKRAVKADATWESLFSEYIEARNEANDHILKAKKSTAKMEAARKKLEAFVKGLK